MLRVWFCARMPAHARTRDGPCPLKNRINFERAGLKKNSTYYAPLEDV